MNKGCDNMTINKTIDSNIIVRLHELVKKNTSPIHISKCIVEEFSIEISEPNINDYIRNYCCKEWLASTKQSKKNSNQTIKQMGLFEEGMYIDLEKNTTPATETSPKTDNEDLNEGIRQEKTPNDDYKDKTVEETTTPTSLNNKMFDSLEIIDYLKSLHKSMMLLDESNRNLSNRITKLENKITEMQSNNPYEKVQKFADDLINIYANEKSKKSVNINPLINDRIIEAMHKKYNISNNNALAINTALLLALYKSGIDTMPDKK